MRVTISKVVALLIAIGYVVAIVIMWGEEFEPAFIVLRIVPALIFILALIWFPEAIGGFTGYTCRFHVVDTESQPGIISFLGWFFLVGLPLIIYLVSR